MPNYIINWHIKKIVILWSAELEWIFVMEILNGITQG